MYFSQGDSDMSKMVTREESESTQIARAMKDPEFKRELEAQILPAAELSTEMLASVAGGAIPETRLTHPCSGCD
jgi:hypothetical protein